MRDRARSQAQTVRGGDRMARSQRFILVLLAAGFVVAGASGVGLASEPEHHAVSEGEIQARIDQRHDQSDSDRQAIEFLLRRPEVQQIAGAGGVDLERASVAAGALSGAELGEVATKARQINAALVGGDSSVVISGTVLILLLIIVILLVA